MTNRTGRATALAVLVLLALPLAGDLGPAPLLGAQTDPSIVAPGATVEKLAGGFEFTEGATSDAEGNVYFSDQPKDRILKWSVDGQLSTVLEPAGRTNGMTFDAGGRLLAAADKRNELWSIDLATKKATVLVKEFEGKLLNGPNDIWVQPGTGRIYFTDAYYQREYWQRGPREIPESVYVYTPATGTLTAVVTDMVRPNGIIGTPDGKQVYISDIDGRATYRYDIAGDGSLTNKTLFCNTGSDGMTIDSQGNVYLSARTVQVFNPQGERIANITVPEAPANLCFGGRDRHTLFITARTGLYALKMRVSGVGPQ